MKLMEVADNFVDQIILQVDRDCKPYINSLGGWAALIDINMEKGLYHLFRGMKNTDSHGTKVVHKDRVPKDTPEDAHEMMDDWFEDTHGHRFRSNAMFATGKRSLAEHYGHVFSVFPVGNFKACYSPLYQDLWDEFGAEGDYDVFADIDETNIEDRQEYIEHFLEKGKYTTKADMKKMILSQKEIMVACNKYHYVHFTITKSDGMFWDHAKRLLQDGKIK